MKADMVTGFFVATGWGSASHTYLHFPDGKGLLRKKMPGESEIWYWKGYGREVISRYRLPTWSR